MFDWNKIIIAAIPPLIAVIVAWAFAFIPQKRQNIQRSIFELMKNQMDLLNRIEIQKYKGAIFFIYAKRTLKRLYDFISKEIEDEPKDPTVYYSNPLNSEVLEFSDTLCGRESLKIFYRNRPNRRKDEMELQFERRKAEYTYEYFFELHYIFVGHYFRHLFNIIKFIHKKRGWIRRKFYTGFVQAQMSAPELYLLFYNGLKFSKMEKFINKYDLIENLAREDLMRISHSEFYKCSMKSRNELEGEMDEDIDIFIDKPTIKKGFDDKLNFEFLSLNEIIAGIKVKWQEGDKNIEYNGIEFFDYLRHRLKQYYILQVGTSDEKDKTKRLLIDFGLSYGEVNKIINDSPASNPHSKIDINLPKKIAEFTFRIIYDIYHEYLDKYFNKVLYILKYLERKDSYIKKFDSDISEYVDLFNTRLSLVEKFLLFYGGLYIPEMEEYLAKYNLFTGLTLLDLIDDKHQRFYKWEISLKK